MKSFEQTTTTYTYQGTTYDSLEAMPEDIRKHFADKDADGVPDWVEPSMVNKTTSISSISKDENEDGIPDWMEEKINMLKSRAGGAFVEITDELPDFDPKSSFQLFRNMTSGSTTYKIGDNVYESLDEMPEEHRKLIEKLTNVESHQILARIPQSTAEIPSKPVDVPTDRPNFDAAYWHDSLREYERGSRRTSVYWVILLVLLAFALGGLVQILLSKI